MLSNTLNYYISFFLSRIVSEMWYTALFCCIVFYYIAGQLVLHRLYEANKEEIDAQIIQRLIDDALKKKQEEEEAKQVFGEGRGR